MFMPLVMILAVLSSLVVPMGVAVAIMAYIKRTKVMQASMEEGSQHAEVMDNLEQVHVRLDAMTQRLNRIEKTLQSGPPAPQRIPDSHEAPAALPPEASSS